MNTKKAILFSVIAVFLLTIIVVFNRNDSLDITEVSHNGIDLNIPTEYIFNNNFSSLQSISGLDTSSNNFIVEIPKDEINGVRPENSESDAAIILYLLSDQQKQELEENSNSIRLDIVNKRNGFEDAYEEVSENALFYVVFQNERLTNRWYVFTNSVYPSINSDNNAQNSKTELIGLCQQVQLISPTCKLQPFFVGNIGIEMSISYSDLNNYEEVKNSISELISQWQN